MFDVNKAIMRCLVKNLAMFGLGLYIYSGEDLPEIEIEKISAKDANILKNVVKSFDDSDKLYVTLLKKYNVTSFKELTVKQRVEILDGLAALRCQRQEEQGRRAGKGTEQCEAHQASRATMPLTGGFLNYEQS